MKLGKNATDSVAVGANAFAGYAVPRNSATPNKTTMRSLWTLIKTSATTNSAYSLAERIAREIGV